MNLLLVGPEEVSSSGEVLLHDERARHLLDVLGVHAGQYVRLGVLDGPKGRAEVLWTDDDTVRLRCELDPSPPERPRLDLVLAVPRPKVLKRLWAPLAAMGVGRIYLTNAKRVERFYFDSHAIRPEVFRPRLIEGLAQARDTRVPEVQVHKHLRMMIEQEVDAAHPDAKRIVADPVYRRSAIRVLSDLAPERRVLLAIGPEGGWDPLERDLLERYAFTGVGLGARTLRSDTAVIALVSIVHEALRAD
ncbi:MAG: 16S rRNA (uracil(1498)-N(3))-methyltransferase [Sandaracinaceae bacterium]|nr:16S rRNA (uracil(1498)-N(3))-methyltransferase [Sandaracinaceae bacterium]